MKSFVIIRSGNTWPQIVEHFGEFETQFLNRFSVKPAHMLVVKAQEKPTYPLPANISGVIVSGAHDNVTDNAQWMNDLAKWIVDVHNNDIPMLGVCFGHQIIGKALGAKVGFNPNGDEYGLVPIQMKTNELVFGQKLPDKFMAYATHSQSILQLPKGAVSLAKSELEPYHIVHFGNKSWGFQFHPEFTFELTSSYISAMENALPLGTKEEQFQAEKIGRLLLNGFINECT